MLCSLKRAVSMDGSFEHPKLKIIGKKIYTILPKEFCLSKPMYNVPYLRNYYMNWVQEKDFKFLIYSFLF